MNACCRIYSFQMIPEQTLFVQINIIKSFASFHIELNSNQTICHFRRVLQNSSDTTYNGPSSPKGSLPTGVANRKIICKRRASIATFSQQQLPETKVITDIKKMMKRTSDLSLRASSLTRNGRPPRLE